MIDWLGEWYISLFSTAMSTEPHLLPRMDKWVFHIPQFYYYIVNCVRNIYIVWKAKIVLFYVGKSKLWTLFEIVLCIVLLIYSKNRNMSRVVIIVSFTRAVWATIIVTMRCFFSVTEFVVQAKFSLFYFRNLIKNGMY